MLMALSTLCQLLNTKAIADERSVIRGTTGPAQHTFRSVRESGQLLLKSLHLRCRRGAEIAKFFEILQFSFLLINPRHQSRRMTPSVG